MVLVAHGSPETTKGPRERALRRLREPSTEGLLHHPG